jgi:molybdate transport system substrate-binding protein
MRKLTTTLALLAGLVVAIGAGAAHEPTTITVFAAASLTDAFRAIGKDFEAQEPDARVRFSFAGSQELVSQLHQGAPADVFASADDRQMAVLKADRPEVIARPFAFNELTVALPNPGRSPVRSLADLACPGLKVVIADPAVPAGRYTATMLERAARLPAYGAAFPAKVRANVVSRETNVRQVAMKVSLGEADAGIVYVSDAQGSLAGKLRTVAIPPAVNVRATYPIAVLATGARRRLAEAFVTHVLSPAGQNRLHAAGFVPVTAARR